MEEVDCTSEPLPSASQLGFSEMLSLGEGLGRLRAVQSHPSTATEPSHGPFSVPLSCETCAETWHRRSCGTGGATIGAGRQGRKVGRAGLTSGTCAT